MGKVKILIVEDDEEINRLICKALKIEGYEVKPAFDGREALEEFEKDKFKIVLLDIMLPYINGIEVMRKIREKSTVPIIVLSAKGEETDKIIGLGLGADDYMSKPFSIGELLARVKAQLRRHMYFDGEKVKENIIKHGDIIFNVEKYSVVKNGEELNLTAKEIEILKLFFENPNKVFTKVQIFNRVWEEEFVGDDNTVMVHIRRLRRKIEDNPNAPKYIITVWGIGYKLGDIK